MHFDLAVGGFTRTGERIIGDLRDLPGDLHAAGISIEAGPVSRVHDLAILDMRRRVMAAMYAAQRGSNILSETMTIARMTMDL